VRKAEPIARKVYELLSAVDQLQIRYPDCEHDFPTPVRRESYEFVDQVLKHKPIRQVPSDE
jgi:hypothetical protein